MAACLKVLKVEISSSLDEEGVEPAVGLGLPNCAILDGIGVVEKVREAGT